MRELILQTADGSVESSSGRVLFFSIPRFVNDIGTGDCCFLCGASPASRTFNDEHVIPKWLLKELDLFDAKVTLPNGEKHKYSSYKVPCCQECNSWLGANVEGPVVQLLKQGMSAVADHLQNQGPWLLFTWLNLLFLKTHLKDRGLRYHLDFRKGSAAIADAYDWEALHHVHAVARAPYSELELAPEVLGSFYAIEMHALDDNEFDYCDLYLPRTVLFRFRDVGLVAVLNDSCGSMSALNDTVFQRINGRFSPIQLRELFARMAYTNLLIEERPTFRTEFSKSGARIVADVPEQLRIAAGDGDSYGLILDRACREILETMQGPNVEQLLDALPRGGATFLFNDDGSFRTDSMVPVGQDDEQAQS